MEDTGYCAECGNLEFLNERGLCDDCRAPEDEDEEGAPACSCDGCVEKKEKR